MNKNISLEDLFGMHKLPPLKAIESSCVTPSFSFSIFSSRDFSFLLNVCTRYSKIALRS